MNNSKYTPKDIVEQKFSIPLYQRLFAWTSKEVKKLLSDLKEHFESDQFKKDPEKNPYYLGMLTTINRDGFIDLIDGQQRFTVMILIAIAFMDVTEWKKFLNNGERLKLVARTEDELYLKCLAKSKDCKYVNSHMENALLCIKDFIEKSFENDEQRKEFAIKIYNHLTFFISELPQHYLKEATSLNKYFEVMNSTGKGLEQHEILKVKLLKDQTDSDKLVKIWNSVSQMEIPVIRRTDNLSDEEYADKYRKAIMNCRNMNFDGALQDIQDSINDSQEEANTIDVLPIKKREGSNKKEAREGQESIISFPEFLLLTLDLTKHIDGRDRFYQKDKLIERFEQNSISDVQEFYHNLVFFRLLLDYYVVRRDISNGQSRFTINFREQDYQEQEERISKYESRERLRQYLSMLTVSTEFYIWLKPFMEHLQKLPNDWQKASDILLNLKEDDNKRRIKDGYPQRLRTEQYPQIDRYWFWRLDYYLWEHRADKSLFTIEDRRIVEEYVFRTNRSIEHLHPQDESFNDKWDNNVTNGFGNLAMVSQSFNSLQSNDNIRVKFARIQEQLDNKALQSLKMLIMFRSANEDHSKWNEQLALENLDQMCSLLEKTASNKIDVSSESSDQI